MTNELAYKLKVINEASKELQKITNDLKKLDKEQEKTKKTTSNLGKKFKETSTLLKGIYAGAIAFAINKVVKFGAELVNLYGIQEQADVMLRNALKLQTTEYNKLFNSLKAYAGHLQQISIYGDEVIERAMQMGLSMGLTSDNIEEATKVAIDLAGALGMDLNTAMRYVAQAGQGNVTMLGRYIPALRDLKTEGMSSGEIIKFLGDKVNGFGEAIGQTTIGKIQQMKNAIGDLKEAFGEFLAPAVKKATTNITEFVQAITSQIQGKDLFKQAKQGGIGGFDLTQLGQLEEYLKKQKEAIEDTVIAAGGTIESLKQTDKHYKEIANMLDKIRKKKEQIQILEEKLNKAKENGAKQTKQQLNTLDKLVKQYGGIDKFVSRYIGYYNHLIKVEDKRMDTIKEQYLTYKWLLNVAKKYGANEQYIWQLSEKVYELQKKITEEKEKQANLPTPKQGTSTETNNLPQTYNLAGANYNDFSFFDKIKLAIDGLSAGFNAILNQINPLIKFIIELVKSSQSFQFLMELINKTLIGGIDKALKPLMNFLLPILVPILKMVAKMFELLAKPLAAVGALLMWIMAKLRGFGTLIYYIVTFQWGKLGSVNYGGSLQSYYERLLTGNEMQNYGEQTEITTETTTTTGVGASYTSARAINITFDKESVVVNANIIAGENGEKELAEIIWTNLQDVMELNLGGSL